LAPPRPHVSPASVPQTAFSLGATFRSLTQDATCCNMPVSPMGKNPPQTRASTGSGLPKVIRDQITQV
jgi:hypothetical protein